MARKILFYTHAFSGGGAETVFARLAEAFASGGDDVIFAADHLGPVPPRDRDNLRHRHLAGGHLATTRQLRTLLRIERPDASFSALGAQNLKHLAASLWAGRADRCVLGYHGFAAAEPKRLARASYWASPLATRLAAQTVCVSDALLDDMRRRWHASPTRTVRIHNPVPRPTDGALGTAKDSPPLILGCGRLVPIKRFRDLITALADLEPCDAHLAILGEGPERARLAAAAAEFGLEARVHLPGHVDDPSPWYRRAACLAITSESESFGLTAAEAFMHGLPVVTTGCGGPPEVIGDLGRIVPVGDTAALAKALTETLAAPGDEGPRHRRADSFAIETIHAAYADLIDALGAGRKTESSANRR